MGDVQGEAVHGERIVDGDASAPTNLTLYISGSETTRALADDEFLNITDVFILIEDGGDFTLSAGAAAAGKYIAHGDAAANGGVDKHYNRPFVCPKGDTPEFIGAAANRSTCLIEGFITK